MCVHLHVRDLTADVVSKKVSGARSNTLKLDVINPEGYVSKCNGVTAETLMSPLRVRLRERCVTLRGCRAEQDKSASI